MYQAILVVHILLSLAIIGLVLLQRGKGAEMGAGFGGGGASQSLFGSSGSSSFLTRTTALLATGFFVSCLVLSYLAVHMSGSQTTSYLPEIPVPVTEEQAAALLKEHAIPVSDLPAVPEQPVQ
jgi:preprotein translocase subunit SecG